MNAQSILKELELASWEQAEADSHERAAAKLRVQSAKRMAAIYSEIKLALGHAKEISKSKKNRSITKPNQ